MPKNKKGLDNTISDHDHTSTLIEALLWIRVLLNVISEPFSYIANFPLYLYLSSLSPQLPITQAGSIGE